AGGHTRCRHRPGGAWCVVRPPAARGALAPPRRILDGRNALDADRWREAGWTYRALGRPLA
ncbi:hypothetical protein, partial [Streptomyces hygroscopicus]|uniref:hypothetical protein n=1 Tax=Streptomyces hygroscopicus TaxID=1912 RepID=UPI0036C17710